MCVGGQHVVYRLVDGVLHRLSTRATWTQRDLLTPPPACTPLMRRSGTPRLVYLGCMYRKQLVVVFDCKAMGTCGSQRVWHWAACDVPLVQSSPDSLSTRATLTQRDLLTLPPVPPVHTPAWCPNPAGGQLRVAISVPWADQQHHHQHPLSNCHRMQLPGRACGHRCQR